MWWAVLLLAVFIALCIGYHLGYEQLLQDRRHRETDETRYQRSDDSRKSESE